MRSRGRTRRRCRAPARHSRRHAVAAVARGAPRIARGHRGRNAMSDDELRQLGKELPWDRPDDTRRDAVRSSLLLAAAKAGTRPASRSRYVAVGGAFAAGALAAAIDAF